MVGVALSFLQSITEYIFKFEIFSLLPPRDNSKIIQKKMVVLSYQEKFKCVALFVAKGRHMIIIIMVCPTTSAIFVKGMQYNLQQ